MIHNTIKYIAEKDIQYINFDIINIISLLLVVVKDKRYKINQIIYNKMPNKK